MRYLGIDFGSKKVGISISDPENTYALPKGVLPNDDKLISQIKKICEENEITGIVLGESKDLQGKDNIIMKELVSFKEKIEKELKLPIHLEPEFFTSMEAKQLQGNIKLIDASAAAIILKSFLDKINEQIHKQDD